MNLSDKLSHSHHIPAFAMPARPSLFSFSFPDVQTDLKWIALALLTIALVVVRYQQATRKVKISSHAKHDLKLAGLPARKWLLPAPQSIQDIYTTEEPRYRPFKWGEYKVTMGVRFIAETQWLKLYKSYPAYVRLRELRHSQNGKKCSDVVPHSRNRNHIAALECARSMAAYLAAKYPDLFRLQLCSNARNGDAGSFGEHVRGVERMQSDHLGLPYKHWTLRDIDENDPDSAYNAMQVAGELVPDDLGLLLPDDDATPDERGALHYRLIAGSICTAGFWRLEDKLNLTLQEIHMSGKVPQYAERLRDPLDRFFTKMERGGDRLAERNNYFFQVVRRDDSLTKVLQLRDGTLIPDQLGQSSSSEASLLDDRTELTWGLSTNGPENVYDAKLKGPRHEAGHVTVPADRQSGPIQVELSEPIMRAEDLVMRTERQTLRKLPKSGAIIFTIYTHMVPLQIMANEPGVPGRLAHSMRTWPDDVAWYKAADLYRDVVIPYLDEKHAEQIKSGIIESEEKEAERSRRAYPL